MTFVFVDAEKRHFPSTEYLCGGGTAAPFRTVLELRGRSIWTSSIRSLGVWSLLILNEP